MSCSHCWEDGHTKRTCPDRGRSHEELAEASAAKQREFRADAEAAAKILGRYAPGERVKLALSAFDGAAFVFRPPFDLVLYQQEQAAKERLRLALADGPRLRLVTPAEGCRR